MRLDATTPPAFDTPANAASAVPTRSSPHDGAPPAITSALPERAVCVAGLVFLDVVMVGLTQGPRPGEEQWASDCQMMPGGVAIQAVALARLGVPTTLIAPLGNDPAGKIVREMLARENIDTSHATASARQAVTASLAFDGDRAMTTFSEEDVPPLTHLPTAPAGVICDMRTVQRNCEQLTRWRTVTDATPTWVLADVGWDPTGEWNRSALEGLDCVDVFTPNATEAMRYTRTDRVEDAARILAEQVPTVVITCGESGVYALSHGVEYRIPAFDVPVLDTTGAGDSFAAGLSWGYLHQLDTRSALTLGSLAGAFAVGQPGGSAFAPSLDHLRAWSRTIEVPEGVSVDFLTDPTLASTGTF